MPLQNALEVKAKSVGDIGTSCCSDSVCSGQSSEMASRRNFLKRSGVATAGTILAWHGAKLDVYAESSVNCPDEQIEQMKGHYHYYEFQKLARYDRASPPYASQWVVMDFWRFHANLPGDTTDGGTGDGLVLSSTPTPEIEFNGCTYSSPSIVSGAYQEQAIGSWTNDPFNVPYVTFPSPGFVAANPVENYSNLRSIRHNWSQDVAYDRSSECE